MRSKFLRGQLADRDLFAQVIHSTAKRNEYIDKVNANIDAFEVYVADGAGGEILLTDETLDLADFQNIIKSNVIFGEGNIENAEALYTSKVNLNLGLNYDWKKLSVGLNGNFVSGEFTEFHNFENESADGAIGSGLPFSQWTLLPKMIYHWKEGKRDCLYQRQEYHEPDLQGLQIEPGNIGCFCRRL